MRRKIFYLLILCSCLFGNSHAQIDSAFLKHLSKHKLYTEQITYIRHLNTQEDTTHLLLAKFHLNYAEDSLFFEHFRQCNALFYADSNALNTACGYFMKHANPMVRTQWFSQLQLERLSGTSRELAFYYQTGLAPDKDYLDRLAPALQEDYKKVVKSSRKRPVLAAVLAIIPGAGQLYIGNYGGAASEFFTVGLSAVQLAESLNSGNKMLPLSILNGGFSGAFYLSGIAGAYRDTRHKKKAFTIQYYLHVAQYYSSRTSTPLF